MPSTLELDARLLELLVILELDERTSPLELSEELLEPLLASPKLDEETSLLELSVDGEDGDTEKTKTAREITAANAGIVTFIMKPPKFKDVYCFNIKI
jgi:hypothetical protein